MNDTPLLGEWSMRDESSKKRFIFSLFLVGSPSLYIKHNELTQTHTQTKHELLLLIQWNRTKERILCLTKGLNRFFRASSRHTSNTQVYNALLVPRSRWNQIEFSAHEPATAFAGDAMAREISNLRNCRLGICRAMQYGSIERTVHYNSDSGDRICTAPCSVLNHFCFDIRSHHSFSASTLPHWPFIWPVWTQLIRVIRLIDDYRPHSTFQNWSSMYFRGHRWTYMPHSFDARDTCDAKLYQ